MEPPVNTATLDAALALVTVGFSVIPIKLDGSKGPHFKWGKFQEAAANVAQVTYWFEQQPSGIAVIGGTVSGGLECIDFDDATAFEPWKAVVLETTAGADLLRRLSITKTPRGYHVRYRCDVTEGNQPLARTADGKKARIETRGEGGYFIVEGSPPETHETKLPYVHAEGPPLTAIERITPDERETLFRCARTLDLSPQPRGHQRPHTNGTGNGRHQGAGDAGSPQADERPGDAFDRHGPSWDELLCPHGWECIGNRGDDRLWRRPGKTDDGHSATTGHTTNGDGKDLLSVFSSNAHPFPGPEGGRTCSCFTKFQAFAWLNHGGDFKAAAKALAPHFGSSANKRRKKLLGRAGGQTSPRNGTPSSSEANGSPPTNGTPPGVAGTTDDPCEADTDPHRLARAYLETLLPKQERPLLAYFREQFWSYEGQRWLPRSNSSHTGSVNAFCKANITHRFVPTLEEPHMPRVTTALVGNVKQALMGMVGLPDDMELPSWLGGESPSSRGMIAASNGLLDVDAFVGRADGDDAADVPLLPHTPLWFSPTKLPYQYDAAAGCPTWLAFLDRNIGGRDSARARLLQQYFGYCLVHDTSLQRFLIMVGEGANGKSVICAVIRALLGRENVSSVPLERFGERFSLASTLGKLANVVAEVGELDRVAEGQLKAFVAGDLMEFERKNRDPFSARPTARLILATNNVPTFSDKSDGLWRRMLLLNLTVQIPENERVAGMDQAEWWAARGELPGIMNWALAGLRDLRRAMGNGFTVGDEVRCDINHIRVEANPARRFIEEHYQAGKGDVAVGAVYGHYRGWCEDHGHRPMSEIGFGRELVRKFPGVKKGKMQVKDIDESLRAGTAVMRRVNSYQGIEEFVDLPVPSAADAATKAAGDIW